jgi:hypothetical protein
MKILCLIILSANICLLIWEYRSGAFTSQTNTPVHQASVGQEQIFLATELKNKPPLSLPVQKQETQLQVYKSVIPVKEMQGSIEHVNSAIAKQSDYPQVRLP